MKDWEFSLKERIQKLREEMKDLDLTKKCDWEKHACMRGKINAEYLDFMKPSST